LSANCCERQFTEHMRQAFRLPRQNQTFRGISQLLNIPIHGKITLNRDEKQPTRAIR
jgi:hypothetical protein